MKRVVVASACTGLAALAVRWLVVRMRRRAPLRFLEADEPIREGSLVAMGEMRPGKTARDAEEFDYLLSVHPVSSWA